jgi:hemerythrin-like domain-containing protein
MNAIQHLLEEHRMIAHVVDAFEKYVERIEKGPAPPRADLERFVRFFREFIDLGHHDKEETLLLPAVVQAGMAWDSAPLQRIRRDHDLERYLMRSLRHAALQSEDWSGEDRMHLLAIARELIAFARAHAECEELLVFPEAERRLPAAVSERLALDFSRFDAERTKDGAAPMLQALGQTLIRTYGSAG